ncbi:glycosyltransferase family 4 protein [Streptomyces sp. B6B3]|uniref:glycosyltransferase family 4 protein n=1 Tax=Streptomyces sp. B6B3 TaxID=3153570 RepID=UPI00325EBC9F
MHISVFAENRNGIDLTSRLAAAPGAAAHTFSVVTADVMGQVDRWIREEGERRLGRIPFRNLFAPGEALGDDEFDQEIQERVVRHVTENSVDRFVLFNDTSRRGRRVTAALNELLPVVLVQDGHLDFHHKVLTPGRRDQNWHYGASLPAAVCVWGAATAQHLAHRSPGPAPTVHVTGALGHSDDPLLVRAVRSGVYRPAGRAAHEPLRVILLDQPLGDQGKLDRPTHRLLVTELAMALAPCGSVEIKPHPSTQPGHLDWLAALRVPGVRVLSADGLLDAAALAWYDLAVTFFSTSYLQTLRAGLPLVLYNPPPLNIVFPTVHHPLLRNVGSLEELAAVALRLRNARAFLANQHGTPLEHFLALDEEVGARVLRVIETATRFAAPAEDPADPALTATIAPPAGARTAPADGVGDDAVALSRAPGAGATAPAHPAARPGPAATPPGTGTGTGTDTGPLRIAAPDHPAPDETPSLAERALRDVQRRAGRPTTLAVLGTSFSYGTGVALPVLTYTQSLVAHSPVDVRYFDLAAFPYPEHAADALGGAETVLVNSLAPFWRCAVTNDLVGTLLDAGRPVHLYAHETEYVLGYEAQRCPERHRALLRLLPRMRVLCVSRAQADMFRQLGVPDPIVVYNTVPRDGHRRPARRRPGVDRPRVVMVGTVQDRKGVDLFSRVAELAHARGLPWRFAWIGRRTPRVAEGSLQSDRVAWLGALSRDRVREELAASDAFFLSSVDDPMPLSVVEAVQHRLRVVAYRRVGSHEVLDGVRGYRAFAEYEPAAALAALRDALDEEVSPAAYREVAELFDAPAFAARMSAALGLGLTPGVAGLDEPAARRRFAAVLDQHLEHRAEEFRMLLGAGREESALRVGREILRRQPSTDVLTGMAEVHARHGRTAEAMQLLGAVACLGGRRFLVWREISRIAGLLGPEGRSLRRFAEREGRRIRSRNQSNDRTTVRRRRGRRGG